MFWFWGFLALLAFRNWRKIPAPAAFWTAISLFPYCFLTYMPHVPSRHIYLASAGLALIAGAALVEIQHKRLLFALALTAILLHNTGYIWVKKRQQFLDRAEPTERLIAIAREKGAPMTIGCFPYSPEVAERAVEILLNWKPGSLRFAKEPGGTDLNFCQTTR